MECVACVYRLKRRQLVGVKGKMCKRHERTRRNQTVKFWREIVRGFEYKFTISATGGTAEDRRLYERAKGKLETAERMTL
jgi:hypothetical protein